MKQGTIQLPPQASTVAQDVDRLYYVIYYLSVFFFVLIVAAMVYFCAKYYRRGKFEKTDGKDHSFMLEFTWTVIPSIILLVIFVWGSMDFLKLKVAPRGAQQIRVTGQKWFWSFDYPTGQTTVNDLVVPVNTPVELLMASKDVIHSFFVPSFRVKYDVIPNRYTTLWFEATEVGEFPLYCTEYCGTQHSLMRGTVKVLAKEDYNTWLEEQGAAAGGSLADQGAKLYKSKACFTCHSVDGSRLIGPSFKGRFGTEAVFVDGSKAKMNENYIRQSILEPLSQVVAGYDPVMPTYQGVLKDREIDALVEYIKSLNP